ncbi:hypothetical protein [Maricaulis sp. MIT060901]|uniref:hypothetical protein n=1 Tax=Maricaulis sp. MIT060901 TaxID=3096993 RepID=UPI00399B57E7
MSCRTLVEDLRFVRSGQHFIVFIDYETDVVIVDFLHARSNLDRHLADLAGRGE